MTETEKEKIRFWRGEGVSYSTIAERLNLSENTIKSFCRRSNLAGTVAAEATRVCRYCGAPLERSRKRQRKFCSDSCRLAWWNTHPELVNRQAFYPKVCAYCGGEFQSYGNQRRKYCSHACYIAARFGKQDEHDERSV